ncbi:MAG TPA: hypothetical protein VJX94_08795 [Stellaceae bacterium]|nr:hypothetical protein [Stellaceae bacterium]
MSLPGYRKRLSRLIVFLTKKLHQLLDVGIHQIDRQNLSGMGSDAHDKIHRHTIDDQKAAIATANR